MDGLEICQKSGLFVSEVVCADPVKNMLRYGEVITLKKRFGHIQ